MPPTIPINHYFGHQNQQNTTKVVFHYPMLIYSSFQACFEHSNFFKVNSPTCLQHPLKDTTPIIGRTPGQLSCPSHPGIRGAGPACLRTQSPMPTPANPTTSFLTATTLIYAIGAGITAAAGTRLALQWVLVKLFTLYSFQLRCPKGPALLFIVTTSPCRYWVIYAPAAFLGCGSHFSGSLSGIEPKFPVTRCNHVSPLH